MRGTAQLTGLGICGFVDLAVGSLADQNETRILWGSTQGGQGINGRSQNAHACLLSGTSCLCSAHGHKSRSTGELAASGSPGPSVLATKGMVSVTRQPSQLKQWFDMTNPIYMI